MRRAGVLLLVLLAAPTAGVAQKLTLSGPPTVIGDGNTPVTLTVTGPPRRPLDPDALQVEVDAGMVVGVQSDGAGLSVVYRPPRVAAPLTVRVRARLRAAAAQLDLAVQPPATAAAEVSSGGPLALRAPGRLVLGRDGSIPVRLGSPAGVPPRLIASTGSLEPPALGPDGELLARYTPPDQRFPGVAIIAAVDAAGEPAEWIRIQLIGLAQVSTRVDKNAQVSVAVGPVTYGPIAGRRGSTARFTVEVPPGVDSATATAMDELGNARQQRLPIGAPAAARMLLLCSEDGERATALVATVAGDPDDGEAPALTASAGAIDAPRRVAPGRFEVRLTPPEDTTIRTIEVRGRIGGQPEAVCRTTVPGEPPSGVSLTVSRPRHQAGEGAPIDVEVRLAYPGRRHPRAVEVTLSADLGVIDELQAVAPDRWIARWSGLDRFAGRRRAELVARAGPLEASAAVALLPGRPVRIDLTADRPSARADGRSRVLVRARAVDGHDNPVPAALIGSAAGALGPFSAAGADGWQVAGYTAPRRRQDGDDVIVVQTAGVQARVGVLLRGVPGRFAAGARIGYQTNFGAISAPLIAAQLDTRLPLLAERLVVGVTTGYFSGSRAQPTMEDETIDLAVSGVPLLARVFWEQRRGRLRLRAGGTGGILWARTELSSPSIGSSVDSAPRPAAGGFGALGWAVGRGHVELELGYLWAPGAEPARGNLAGAGVSGGYGVDF